MERPRACIGKNHFAQSLIQAGLAPISRVRTLAAVKSLFGFCQRQVSANPATELALPSYEHRLAERIVGEDEVKRLVEVDAGSRDRVPLRLLHAAGLRVSEACGLRWRNVRQREDAGQFTVFGKNGRTRSIALTAPLWSELVALCQNAGAEDPVFPSRTGRRLDRGRVRVILRRAARCRSNSRRRLITGSSLFIFLIPSYAECSTTRAINTNFFTRNIGLRQGTRGTVRSMFLASTVSGKCRASAGSTGHRVMRIDLAAG